MGRTPYESFPVIGSYDYWTRRLSARAADTHRLSWGLTGFVITGMRNITRPNWLTQYPGIPSPIGTGIVLMLLGINGYGGDAIGHD